MYTPDANETGVVVSTYQLCLWYTGDVSDFIYTIDRKESFVTPKRTGRSTIRSSSPFFSPFLVCSDTVPGAGVFQMSK